MMGPVDDRARSSVSRLHIDDHNVALYTVGQVADMLGVQPAFLRRLDTEAVVSPARSTGGQRRYSRAEIHLIDRVSALADDGMTLMGIRRVLELEAEVTRLKAALADLANENTKNRGASDVEKS